MLDGDWMVNHYGGSEGFLGWMALSPRAHVTELSQLGTAEAAALGGNIQSIDRALHRYWERCFRDDPLDRVYVVYFFESGLEETKGDRYHLHIHLIPRPRSFTRLLRNWQGDGSVYAWGIHGVSRHSIFPRCYRKGDRNVEDLMAFLREHCGKARQ